VRVLLVEDDELLGDGIQTALTRAGYSVHWVRDGKTALDAVLDPSNVIILDLGLPGRDGLDVLRHARRSGITTPVLVLSARDAPTQRVLGLDAGADDYLVKPFDRDELFARLRALQRRWPDAGPEPLDNPKLRLDTITLSVTYGNRVVALQRREFMLLRKLLESAGQVLSRTQLEESLYGWEGGAESNAVDVHIHNLRKKLDPGLIRTVRGVGYAIDRQTDFVTSE